MFSKLCVRERVLLTVVIVLIISSGTIFFLIDRMEREVYSSSSGFEPLFFYNYFSGMVLTGDIHNSFMLNKDYPLIDKNNDSMSFLSSIHRLKIQILVVFGLSLIAGIVLSVITSRGITRPIMQLIHASKNVNNCNIEGGLKSPKCAELRILTESFKKMHENVLEYEDEKSRLESVEITKNLAAGIAHEIKNPINTVGLIADYLQANLSPDDPEKRYEFYKLSENMKNELKRINRIVEGFLRLTKPGGYNFKKEDINSIIQYNVSILEQELIRHGIKIHLNFNSALPAVKVDRDRLNQVFSNLILNAIEAMPRGGDITITTEPDGEKVSIQVSDNGFGIPQEDIRKVFNPYFSTKEQGFGLGLTLIQDIIHNHKGRIAVQSEKGKGTDFTILLPVDFSNE